MKKINKITLTGFSALLIWLVTAFTSVQTKSDLSGKWAIDKEKSDFSGLPSKRAAPVSIKIVQKTDSMRIERLFEDLPLNVETYSFDGRALELTYPGTVVTRVLTWGGEGKAATIASKYKMTEENGDTWEYTRTEIYSLADGDKTLILERTTVAPDATEKVKAVYRRQ